MVAYRSLGCAAGRTFRRGDADGDGTATITDAVLALSALFLGGDPPACPDAADSNDDGVLNLTDPVFLLGHLFLGGPEPPLPGPSVCGIDPTDDELDPCGLACVAGG